MYVVGRRATSTGAYGGRETGTRDPRRRTARGFSLMELLVVLTVTLMLTGLMLPALSQVHENAHRVVCASNLRQIGLATVLYADDHDGDLPPSFYAQKGESKQEMMAVHTGRSDNAWEGLGWLWWWMYITAPEILYCPSHMGDHPYERYAEMYLHPGGAPIYGDYHYAGPVDWEDGSRRRLDSGENIVLATDGLRTLRDFNHRTGMNVLRGDNSVNWRDDQAQEVAKMLPGAASPLSDGDSRYARIWNIIEAP